MALLTQDMLTSVAHMLSLGEPRYVKWSCDDARTLLRPCYFKVQLKGIGDGATDLSDFNSQN